MRNQRKIGWIITGILLGAMQVGFAQGSVRNNAKSPFQDGIYLSFAQFQANQPAFSWKEIRGTWFYNPESGITTVVDLYVKDNEAFPLDSLWGLCLNGRPSLRMAMDSVSRTSVVFVPFKMVGAISYFAYDGLLRDTVEISAYNPESGRPFRKGKVERQTREFRERILWFQTGEILPLNRLNLLQWIDRDAEIRRALTQIQEGEESYQEKLLRAIEVYNQRNPITKKN